MKYSAKIKGYIFVILSAIIFGCMPLMATKIYADGVNPLSLVLLRNFLSVPMLAVAALLTKKTLKIPLKSLPTVSVIGLLGCCITPLMLFASYIYIPSGVATVFHFVYPAVVLIINIIIQKKSDKGSILSVIICFIGICFFYNPNDPLDFKGASLALLSGVVYALYIIMLSRFKQKEISGFLLSFYISVSSSVVLLCTCAVIGNISLPQTAAGWGLSFFFAFVVNVGAVVLFQHGTALIGSQQSSILSTFEPITSVVIDALLLTKVLPSIPSLIGCILVILASILIVVFDIKKEKSS
ncbi:MAG: DMT family transporter [Clostridia bacterium]|nr:DMT family transporter [Clostridia bacterium]